MDISFGAERRPSAEERILKALEVLKDFDPYDNDLGEFDCSTKHMNDKAEEAIDDLLENVPKLMEAYAELGLLTAGLMSAVEQEREGKTPSGLVLPK